MVEDDPVTGKFYVGRGCYPNADGVVQLDAAVMRGSDCSFGAVAALERYVHPVPSVNLIKVAPHNVHSYFPRVVCDFWSSCLCLSTVRCIREVREELIRWILLMYYSLSCHTVCVVSYWSSGLSCHTQFVLCHIVVLI